METVSKFLSGALGGSMVSGFLLFIFRGQNKKIDEQNVRLDSKVDTNNCKLIVKQMDKTTDEIKADIKSIINAQTEQLTIVTETKTILHEMKKSFDQRRRTDIP